VCSAIDRPLVLVKRSPRPPSRNKGGLLLREGEGRGRGGKGKGKGKKGEGTGRGWKVRGMEVEGGERREGEG